MKNFLNKEFTISDWLSRNNPEKLVILKDNPMENKKDIFELSDDKYFIFYFIDYNNGFEKEYYRFYIDKNYKDIDWQEFINSIPTTRFTGCQITHFQDALWNKGIKYVMLHRLSQGQYNSYMTVEYNKTHSMTVEHQNSGNY